MLNILLGIILSYLIGSISSGIIISKLYGINNLRSKGSGNTGASNVLRVGGKMPGILTLILDFIKGAIAVQIADTNGLDYNYQILFCLFAVLGHIFPIWHSFKGGKGVATIFGGLAFINPFTGIIFFTMWLSIFYITKIASISSLLTIIIIFIISIFTYSLIFNIILFFNILLIFFKHLDNIKRLLSSTENKF